MSFDQTNWKISINGKDVSRKFGAPLTHNKSWTYVRRARAVSGFPIRRFTVLDIFSLIAFYVEDDFMKLKIIPDYSNQKPPNS